LYGKFTFFKKEMKKEKKYYLKRIGNRKLSHLLVNIDDEKDVIKLCACGRT